MAESSLDPLIGRVVLDRYEVRERIGAGGMGAVYVAKQLTVGREVAVKILRAELVSNEMVRERFRREAEIIGRLKHPNTIQLIDYGETDDGLCVMVMELLKGDVLSDTLKEHGALSLDDVLALGEEVSGSLAEAHALGLVHRDLKPGNIFIAEIAGEAHAKVLDFGIARMLDEQSTRITTTGQVFGTPRYMSPEQGVETGEVDHRSDIYSLGLILFECLVGQPPFVAQTSLQYLNAHATRPPPRLSERLPTAPVDLERLIAQCLEKDPETRVQSAAEVQARIRDIRESLVASTRSALSVGHASVTSPSVDARLSGPPVSAPAQKKKSAAPLVAAVIAVIVIGAGLGLYSAGGRTDDVVVVSGGTPDLGQQAAPDAQVVAGAVDAADVVAEVDVEDAGHEGDAELVAEPARQTKKKKRRHRKKKGDDQIGGGVISGPRQIRLPVGDDPVQAARSCRRSELEKGTAKLDVSGCDQHCRVLVGGRCAGKVPIESASLGAGNRQVTVVCGDKVVLDQTVRFRSGKTTTLRCR